ncbi:MAG: shikimate kinase [bacterium]
MLTQKIKNIVLIGFMCAGKSTVGDALASKICKKFCEMDDAVRSLSEKTSTMEIFDEEGERQFREYEIQIAKRLSKERDAVIATGGGVVMNKINIDYLRETGKIIFLQVSFEEVQRRLQHDRPRPLFRDVDLARDLYTFREPLYRKYSDIMINVDNKTPETIVNEIINMVGI